MIAGTPWVKVAWSGQLTGVITVGSYVVGSTDVVGGTFGYNVFDDISSDVYSVTIRRGRTSDRGAMTMGTADLVLLDETGKYNPKNAASTLYDYLKPRRPLKITETYSGTEYGLHYGFTDDIRHDPVAKKSYIKTVDLFDRLARHKPTIAATGATNVGAAIGLVLDARGWTVPGMRALDTGHAIPNFEADASKAGSQYITDLLAADLGTFFVDGDGITTYHSLSRRYARGSVVAAWTAAMVGGAQPGTSGRRIVNYQSVTRTGGVEQIAQDTDSQHEYDIGEGSAVSSGYLSSDAQALDCGKWLVTVGKDPLNPTNQLVMVNADEDRLLQILGRDIGDYVSAVVDNDGNTVSGWIDGLEIQLGPGDHHRATYYLTEKTVNMITVGSYVVGSADVVGY